MKKKLLLSVIGLLIVIVAIGGIKALQISALIDSGKSFSFPPATVTAYQVSSQNWQTSLSSVGTFEAIRGVTVSAELAGKVVDILFTSGAQVENGELLVTLNHTSELAQLKEVKAEIVLAQLDLKRKAKLIDSKVISQSDYDIAKATYDEANARVANIQSLIDKKHIHAPFSGQLGIRQVNLGQNLQVGDAVVTLQSLDPIYVNFSLPQYQYAKLKNGLDVHITNDAMPNEAMQGSITTISPLIDETTRNIQVQATVPNNLEKAIPGMFAKVEVILPAQDQVIAIPITAVLYAPYGDSVFVIEEPNEEGIKTVRQQFVKLGRAQGDFVSVTSGVKVEDVLVSTGVFKLQNDQTVVIDNSLAPEFQLQPQPKDV